MSTPHFHQRLPLALAATLLILTALMTVAVTGYFRRAGAENWKTHTYEVLLEIDQLHSRLLDAQTAARGYALTNDPLILAPYVQTRALFARHLQVARRLTADNPDQQKRLAIIDTLHARWRSAVDAFVREQKARGGPLTRTEVAERVHHNAHLMRDLRATLDEMEHVEQNLLAQRSQIEARAQRFSAATLFTGGVLGLLAMTLLSFTLVRNLKDLTRAGEELQRENRERQNAEAWVRESNAELQEQIAMLEQRNREIELLSQSGELLQACSDLQEARHVLSNIAPRLFPDSCGGIYLFNKSGNLLEAAARWNQMQGDDCENGEYFAPDQCWALRRGAAHFFQKDAENSDGLACRHLAAPPPPASLCLPMHAQSSVLGLLTLSQTAVVLDENQRRLALAFAEQIALAVANLQLRETLRHQSIRDPLTNLYNRRYLEESLERELSRAARDKDSVGVIMIDLDHFKKFNDTFHHDAGDAFLRAVAQFLTASIRGGDIACRYGGEELTLILPEASLEGACCRAEKIREGASQMTITHRGQTLGPVTLSLGVAIFPTHGSTPEALLKAADVALYRAKNEGRNRVVCLRMEDASTPETDETEKS